ncbi:hypothetical protein [Actinoplanes sp. GCM10030250]|uniref:hypothetical protein n=1 Tax=Actinoplanes sp. GCM10030250 TaxID=3273376 RepID=UPI0036239B05
MDDALVAYNSGRVDGAAGLRDPRIAEDPEVGADYRVGLLDGRIAAFHLMAEIRKVLGVEGSLFEQPEGSLFEQPEGSLFEQPEGRLFEHPDDVSGA